jgi:carboxymethylenebutenolidase
MPQLSLPTGGRGPGVVVLEKPSACDWYAARGFVAICPDPEDAADAISFLRTHPACTGRVGVVGTLAFLLSVRDKPDAAVSYYDDGIDEVPDEARNFACPLLLHREYDSADAELVDLRTIDFLLRTLVVRPHALEAIWAKHVEHEFSTHSTEDTLDTMVDDAHVVHIPVLTGGSGREQLRDFYSRHFIPQMPPDTTLTPVSRTIGDDQIVDEMIFQFTHTVKMDWMLPGIEPTGKRVEVPLVAIVKFRGDKLAHEHIYWDQASVLVQLGLLDRANLPVTGIESARKLLPA